MEPSIRARFRLLHTLREYLGTASEIEEDLGLSQMVGGANWPLEEICCRDPDAPFSWVY